MRLPWQMQAPRHSPHQPPVIWPQNVRQCRFENGVDGMRKPAPRRDALSSQYALEVQKETGHEEE